MDSPIRTLIVAPHMDDEVISCAGLIQKRVENGTTVVVLVLHGRKYGYYNATKEELQQELEDFKTAKHLLKYDRQVFVGLEEGEPSRIGYYNPLRHVEEMLFDYMPDEVILPSAQDLNQDHRHLSHVMDIALRPINLRCVGRVLEFHGLDAKLRQPNYFVKMSRNELDTKLAAVSCYRRESRTLPSPRAPENIEAQARVWGSAVGAEFAEAYTLLKTHEG